MKRFVWVMSVRILIVISCFSIPLAAQAQQTSGMSVASAVICRQISSRQAVDPGTRFPATVGKLYCLSKITNIAVSTHVVHVWYYGAVERARVTLNVNPPAWRTYSSKIIQPHEIGTWRVEIQDDSGSVLQTVNFEITP